MKLLLRNHYHQHTMTICIANAVVEKLHRLPSEIGINLDTSKGNTLTIVLRIKTEEKKEFLRRSGSKTYQRVVGVGRHGTMAKNGAQKYYKNYVDRATIFWVKKTQIGEVALTRKLEDLGAQEIIYNSRSLLETATRYVLSVAQAKIYTSIILNHLLITLTCVLKKQTQDCFALSVTRGRLILGAKREGGWCL